MEHSGKKTATNPAVKLSSLMNRREKLQEELRSIEKQVYELETTYLQDSTHFGNLFKGFECFLSSSKSSANLKRSRKFQPEDRVFSLSSVTSPAVEEHGAGRDDFGPGRSKGGSVPTYGQGKPKKGRLAPRDAKRVRASNDADIDDEDDADLGLR